MRFTRGAALLLSIALLAACSSPSHTLDPVQPEAPRLANGTRLAPVSDSVVKWGDGAWWLHVRTPQGAEGWVNVTDGPITWVDDP